MHNRWYTFPMRIHHERVGPRRGAGEGPPLGRREGLSFFREGENCSGTLKSEMKGVGTNEF